MGHALISVECLFSTTLLRGQERAGGHGAPGGHPAPARGAGGPGATYGEVGQGRVVQVDPINLC